MQADTLELENRILRDINEEQDRDIRQLRTELSSMKQASMVHEHERRRAESKVSLLDTGCRKDSQAYQQI
jgi:predicted RNase H-like nuclease (RuvC/YqgF family)